MRWKMAWVATEWNETMGWGMKWSFTGCLCVDIFVRGLQPISEIEWLCGFVAWNEEGTYAVRCWGGRNELSAMEWRVDVCEVRTASPETKWEKRMNRPQAYENKTRHIFYRLQPLKGRRGIWWSFGQRSGAKRWFCAAIIHNLVIGLSFRGLSPERSEPIW